MQQTNNFEDLLPIEENQIGDKTVRTVSARNLYVVLGLATSQFSRWIKKNLLDNSFFSENKDFLTTRHDVESAKGIIKEIEDYQITIEVAKHLSMLSRSKKAHEIRNYFIQVEETFLQIVGLKTKAEAETTLFENLNNLDAVFDDLDKLDTTLSKLEKITKRLDSKSILELYRMNKFTLKVLNFSIFEFFGIKIDEMFFIPTELGKIFGKSPVEINRILEHKGFQTKIDSQWQLTEKGESFGIKVENSAFVQLKWNIEAIA